MFWRFGGYANISSLDTILDKPDVTLEELLDESDLIQELKQQNSKLIEFLREEPVLHRLLRYVVADSLPNVPTPPADDADEKPSGLGFFGKSKARSRSKSARKSIDSVDTEEDKKEAQRKKYAYVSCEVLSSEVWSITESLFEYQDHLREFWHYLQRPAPLDPLQAGYFTKVNETLLDKKTEDMLVFFKSLDNIVPLMLRHVDCPMVMDLLLKIISLEKHEGGQGIVDWLHSQHLVPTLLSYLSQDQNVATQTAAGDFLKAIITISANATTQDQTVIGPNELTRQLVSEPCIGTLIGDMLQGGNPLTVGVGIIIEVIRKNNSDYDLDNQVGPEPKTTDPIYLGTLLRQFAQHVPDFMRLIRSPSSKRPDLKTAFGARVEPLGFDRFKTCELMAELLHCSNMGLLNERGSEAEIRARDQERERLKTEGRLDPPRSNSYEEPFASSVDSHGFHHAERPEDDLSGSPEEIKKLEVQNASDEDGFENVAVPETEALPDEVTFDDFNEKLEDANLPPLTKSDDPSSIHHVPQETTTSAPPPADEEPSQHDPTPLDDSAVTPTEQVGGLQLDSPEQPLDEPQAESKRRVSLLTQQFQQQVQEAELNETADQSPPSEAQDQDMDDGPHPEDKPAPLFAGKESPPKATEETVPDTAVSEDEDIGHSTATLQPNNRFGEATNDRSGWEPDIDGSPVVGDLLKIMFVEHQVVPTILDFFFRFPWNNFLHNVVYDVVQQVFNGSFERGYNRALAIDLFCTSGATELASTADITQRILDGQAASDKSQQEKGMRLGYMGHLTLIAEEVLKLQDRQPPELLGDQIMERVSREEWNQYLETTLNETRDRDNAVLGGVKPDNGTRQMGMGGGLLGQGGFSGGNSNALADAGIGGAPADSLALQDAADGGGYDMGGGSAGLLSGFGNGDDDEEMDEGLEGERREKAVSDDEQASTSPSATPPAPLNIPPSRARLQLAVRLAARKKEAEELEIEDHGTESERMIDPLSELPDLDLSASTQRELQEAHYAGLHISGLNLRGSGHTSDMDRATNHWEHDGSGAGGVGGGDGFSSSSSSGSGSASGSDSGDELTAHFLERAQGHQGRVYDSFRSYDGEANGGGTGDGGGDGCTAFGSTLRRRPSTTEAKYRVSLDDEDTLPVSSERHQRRRVSGDCRGGGGAGGREGAEIDDDDDDIGDDDVRRRKDSGRNDDADDGDDDDDDDDDDDSSDDSDVGDVVEIRRLPRRAA